MQSHFEWEYSDFHNLSLQTLLHATGSAGRKRGDKNSRNLLMPFQARGNWTTLSMGKRTDKGRSTPFSVEDFKYTLDEFLAFGHDDKGQSVRIVNRITPQIERDIEVMIQSRRFPYKTSGDLVRHALLRHLEWLHRLEPDVPRHFLAAANAIAEIVRDQEMLTQMQQTFSKLDALIESLMGRGDMPEAMRVISQTRGQLSKVPDSRWKREFSSKFSRKYARTGPSPATPSTDPGPESRRLLEFPGTSPVTPFPGEGLGDQVEGELDEQTQELE